VFLKEDLRRTAVAARQPGRNMGRTTAPREDPAAFLLFGEQGGSFLSN